MATKRAPRVTSQKKPKRMGLAKGMWHPELVGVVRGYPKTQEAWQARSDAMRQQVQLYNAEGITGRNGVPDGWAGKKQLINEILAAARAEAAEKVAEMEADGSFAPDNIQAKVALAAALEIVLAEKHTPENASVPLYDAKSRLAAINTVLKYTQKAPATTVNNVTRPEDWLDSLSK